jgi:integrase
LMRAIDAYRGSYVIQCALKLLALTFVRPGELRGAEWVEWEIDLHAAEWRIPAERMKMRVAHIVPLSQQAVEILHDLYSATWRGRYVFRGRGRNPISETTLNAALRSMGYAGKMSAHGFRAMARTLLDEVLGVRPEVIEMQLAHKVTGPLGDAYNRSKYLPVRRAMMEDWANFLDQLKQGGDVVPIGLGRRGRAG